VILRVDPTSAVPPFEQVREQIARMAATGVLPSGARLPTIRQLSKDLDLASGTVARAYRELEADGVIVTRGRHGSFVADAKATARRDAPESAVAEAAEMFAVRAHQLGVDPTHALMLARVAFESIGSVES
jgi:DNA-binding transcriptional regulator YhcF (GntR family)